MPALDSLYRRKSSHWGQYYAILQQELGATATLIDFGNQGSAGLVTASTFTGRRFNASGLAPVWTPSEALSAWDTPFDLKLESNWKGLAPVLTFNGTDEAMTTPDVDFFSRVGGGAAATFSVGAWVRKDAAGTSPTILSKFADVGNREWLFGEHNTALRFGINLRDESVPVSATIENDANITLGAWYFVVCTYDGTDGATAITGAEVYLNGAIVATPTRVDQATFVTMENGTAIVACGRRGDSVRWWPGVMAGGPWSPFFVQAELTAAQVKNLWENMRGGLGI